MLRPLGQDILEFLLPLALGAISFVLGRRYWRRSNIGRRCGIALAVLAIALMVIFLAIPLPIDARPLLYAVGGVTVVLAWAALFLLGVVWTAPGRSFSTAFLAILVLVPGLLLAIEASGPLMWRFLAPELWQRSADSGGCLRQASGFTCAPAAAVMLLHHHGKKSSEGEMAYLGRTTLLGTDAYSMARALQSFIDAEALTGDYDSLVQQESAFLAHVRRPGIGNHAVFVVRAEHDFVNFIDPLDGSRRRVGREDFLKEWDATLITSWQTPARAHPSP